MDNKILILLVYYNRPNTVMYNALRSIIKANKNHTNWELAAIDDGSDAHLQPIASSMLGYLPNTIRYYRSDMTWEEKHAQGGSIHGSMMNEAISESDAEAGIILCDDDALHEESLYSINVILNNNPDLKFFYGDIFPYDPSLGFFDNPVSHLNKKQTLEILNTEIWDRPTASNMVWRLSCNKIENIWFSSPKTIGLDSEFLQAMRRKKIVCEYIECPTEYTSLSDFRLACVKAKQNSSKFYTTDRE